MKARLILLTLVVFFLSAVICSAQSLHMGTWKLNEAKSKFAAGATKNNTVVYEMAGDKVKVTSDGTMNDKAVHTEWTGRFDGKDHPSTGNPGEDTRAYRKINDRTSEFTSKKDGKVIVTGRVVVAADGKSRTVTTTGTTAKGKKFKNTGVFDKQ